MEYSSSVLSSTRRSPTQTADRRLLLSVWAGLGECGGDGGDHPPGLALADDGHFLFGWLRQKTLMKPIFCPRPASYFPSLVLRVH
ncbi:hypothetical protein ABIE67_009037 [Streptomyces sp. V4I8]